MGGVATTVCVPCGTHTHTHTNAHTPGTRPTHTQGTRPMQGTYAWNATQVPLQGRQGREEGGGDGMPTLKGGRLREKTSADKLMEYPAHAVTEVWGGDGVTRKVFTATKEAHTHAHAHTADVERQAQLLLPPRHRLTNKREWEEENKHEAGRAGQQSPINHHPSPPSPFSTAPLLFGWPLPLRHSVHGA